MPFSENIGLLLIEKYIAQCQKCWCAYPENIRLCLNHCGFFLPKTLAYLVACLENTGLLPDMSTLIY